MNRFPGTPPSKEEQLEEELEEIENDVAELTEDEDQASVEEAKEKLEKASADVLETIQVCIECAGADFTKGLKLSQFIG